LANMLTRIVLIGLFPRLTDAISAITETHMQNMFVELQNHIMLCICNDGDSPKIKCAETLPT
jgi:hypothetical protein